MNRARLTSGVVLLLAVLTVMGAAAGLTIGSASAEDDAGAPNDALRSLRSANTHLQEQLEICRSFDKRFRGHFDGMKRLHATDTAIWKRRLAVAEARIDELEKGLPPTHADLVRSEQGRRYDLRRLQDQLKAQTELSRSLDWPQDLTCEEQLARHRLWFAGLLARVGKPAVPTILAELEKDPAGGGRWAFRALALMGAAAVDAAPALRALIADPKMQTLGVANVAHETLDAILGK